MSRARFLGRGQQPGLVELPGPHLAQNALGKRFLRNLELRLRRHHTLVPFRGTGGEAGPGAGFPPPFRSGERFPPPGSNRAHPAGIRSGLLRRCLAFPVAGRRPEPLALPAGRRLAGLRDLPRIVQEHAAQRPRDEDQRVPTALEGDVTASPAGGAALVALVDLPARPARSRANSGRTPATGGPTSARTMSTHRPSRRRFHHENADLRRAVEARGVRYPTPRGRAWLSRGRTRRVRPVERVARERGPAWPTATGRPFRPAGLVSL